MTAAGLAGALTRLGDEVVRTRLPLRLPSADEARTAASQVATQLKDYILPRLADIEAPLLAVVGGSTGAGKSTLVNSLVGRVISPAGVIRPTTKSPVLVTSASDEHWFADGRILPGLVRTTGTADRPNQLRIVVEPSLPEGLAILDAPDIDSIVAQNRELAAQLLDAADLWLFVTSAARYSDAVPWEFLTTAQARSAAMAVILDRVPPQAMEVVPHDLRRLMDAQGLAKTPIFTVPETAVDTDGLLPDDSIAPVRSWLAGLAADASSRRKVV
ncbi:MAG: dynamin family protein, partial [Propionibacteriaceae bacterium]|nr:dynamin family protein [Propionibacteriaceae bacterium]